MKKALLICALCANLFSCSILERRGNGAGSEEENEVRDIEPGHETPLFNANGQEVGNSGDSEISRLNTKIAALETKLDVLTASMERMQAHRSQPVIEAEAIPQPTLAAPVTDLQEVREPPQTAQISAAPDKPAQVSPSLKNTAFRQNSITASGAEKEFRAGMQLFQNGRNLEAASRFALMAEKFPNHLLAGHALYWAGEANARGKQWALAVENWLGLEKNYPRTAYLPEALAGLAKAYDSLGDSTKSKFYRTMLMHSFPKSPIALQSEPSLKNTPTAQNNHPASTAAEVGTEDEQAPIFEENSNNEQKSETP